MNQQPMPAERPQIGNQSWDRSVLVHTAVPVQMTPRERLLQACYCQPVDHPPIWLMRQAGRALPEYRALKEHHTFLELVQTPELAAVVTLQPIRRFDFDAAIVFSDILVVPEALGQPYRFREGGGIQMDFALDSEAAISRLRVEGVRDRLRYVADAIKLVKADLGERTALLGFAGSPWTLANFMLEGGSAGGFTKALDLFLSDRRLFDLLLEKLTLAVTEFLQMQIEAGADALQIFDSLGGVLPAEHFAAASGAWMQRIVAALAGRVPVIVFSKGTHGSWENLAGTGAQVIGLDWEISLAEARRRLPETVGIQGNLDPALLVNSSPEGVSAEAVRLLTAMRGRDGYIFNLGHGLPPNANLDNVASLITTVRNFV
ncbi:MAG: uroporphyrinogen decarboxylase [Verrucomicrobiota bacterium]